jgi:hypothetical protein
MTVLGDIGQEDVERLTGQAQNTVDGKTLIIVKSALEWINKNTTIKVINSEGVCYDNITANIQLFIIKYSEVMQLRSGVTSENISNLSQSFTADTTALIWAAAEELLSDILKPRVSFVNAKDRWC